MKNGLLRASCLIWIVLSCGDNPASTPPTTPPAPPPTTAPAPPEPARSFKIALIPGTHQVYEGARVRAVALVVEGQPPEEPVSVGLFTDAPTGQLELPHQIEVGSSGRTAFDIVAHADDTEEVPATYEVGLAPTDLPAGVTVSDEGVFLVVSDAPHPGCRGLSLTGEVLLGGQSPPPGAVETELFREGRFGRVLVRAPTGTRLDFGGDYDAVWYQGRFDWVERIDDAIRRFLGGVAPKSLPAMSRFYPIRISHSESRGWFDQTITLGWFGDLWVIARVSGCEPVHLRCDDRRCLTR